MKNKFLKIIGIPVVAAVLSMGTGCVKTASPYLDFGSLQDFVALTGGTGGSSSQKIAYTRGSDTVNQTITVDLASKDNPSSPITVTIGYDASQIATFNSANGTNYVALPAANFKLASTTLTIPAGQHYAQTTIQIYTKGLDPATSYMTPITITDGGGKKLSSNLNTLYFYTIGNPLAGVYTFLGKRWNAPNLDTATASASTPNNNTSTSISPLGPTTLFLPDTYLAQNGVNAGTALSFTNNNGVLSNFQVSFYDPVGDMAAVGFSVVTGPILVSYNIVGTAATKYVGSTFRIYYVFFNGSAQRATVDNFIKTQ